MTLTEFLLARTSEDEAQARDAGGHPWRVDAQGCCVMEADGDTWMDNIETHDNGTAPHIASHDPARVLVECQAKRRIVELHDGMLDDEMARGDASAFGADLMHRDVLRLLALPYADHPDFNPAWRAE